MKLLRGLLALLLLLGSPAPAAEDDALGNTSRISLNGPWAFAADYLDTGEANQWFAPTYSAKVWDTVTTPHVWSMDARFPYFIGAGWYRRQLTVPAAWRDQHVRIVFEAVYAQAKVWLNGKLLAEHEGGFTPFEIDVSPFLDFGKANLLVVRADNRWREASGPDPQQQVKGWMEDGGIIRDAFLVATPRVFVTQQKIEAVPDLERGDASIRVVTWVRNTQDEPAAIRLSVSLSRENEALSVEIPETEGSVAPGANGRFETRFTLSREQVHLWSLDSPVLYHTQTKIGAGGPIARETFGIRKFEARGTELLLNGNPVRLGGANRVANGTEFGQNDPSEFVERDLRLMKEAGLELMRMHHVPLSRAVLDWADRHGLLLIEEAGNAGFNESRLASPEVQEKFRAEHRAMMARDWNHPSVVAWSVGNEFASETPAGLAWVKQMSAYSRSLDPTRLICFASNRAAKPGLKPEQEASSLTDFVCLNTYGATPAENAANIDRAHACWPDKPFIVTEFGQRADRVASEADREAWFAEMIRLIRERPFISGASIWSFNDYRSRYVGTNPDGYRWWGLVDAKRNPRGSYDVVRRAFTALEVQEARQEKRAVTVKLKGRSDFPVYPPMDCEVRLQFFDSRAQPLGTQTQQVKALRPGAQVELDYPLPVGTAFFQGEIRRGDFLMLNFGPTWKAQEK